MRFHISNKFSYIPKREGYKYVAHVSSGLEYYKANVKEINSWLDRVEIQYLHEFALYFFTCEKDLLLFLMKWSNDYEEDND